MILSLIIIISIIKNNREASAVLDFTYFGSYLLNLNFVENAPAATLLIGLATLLFARSQFVFGSFPVFDYRIYQIYGPVSIAGAPNSKELYAVDLTNVGKGLGIITGARYWFQFKEPGRPASEYVFPYWFQKQASIYNSRSRYRFRISDVEDDFIKRGFNIGDQWDALHFGEWTAIAPGETRRIMVMTLPLGESLVAFDLLIDFESVLRDRFSREIYMVPRRQFRKAATAMKADNIRVTALGQGGSSAPLDLGQLTVGTPANDAADHSAVQCQPAAIGTRASEHGIDG